MLIVQMAAMRSLALSPPVHLALSSATTVCVFRNCGLAMEMQTVQMAQMSGVSTVARNQHQSPAVDRSFSAATESAFTACGAVMEASTATTIQMKPTAVSQNLRILS